jgi:hypothetical protein
LKNKQTKNIVKKVSIRAIVIVAILLIPVVFRFPWTGSDFVFAGAVLSGCAGMYEFLTRNMNTAPSKMVVAVAILFFIILILGWAAA